TQVERGLCRLWRCHAHRQGGGFAAAAQAHPQRPDQPDEIGRLRRGLRLRPRRARGLLRPGLLPGSAWPAKILRPARTRLRARDQEAAGVLGKAAEGARELSVRAAADHISYFPIFTNSII